MRKTLCLLAGLALVPLAADAQESRWWQFWRDGQTQDEPTTSSREPVRETASLLFSAGEKQRLRDYLRTSRNSTTEDEPERDGDKDGESHGKKGKGKGKDKKNKQKALPPGLQKKVQRGGQLPPGWQMKVERGEVIDGELYSQSEALPPEVQHGVNDPEGTETRRIGDRVFRVMSRSRQILDVLKAPQN